MTDGKPDYGDSRRSFMKKGALATGALAIGASGTALAQEGNGQVGDDGEGTTLGEGWKALTFVSNFHPNARFAIVSDVVEWVPNYGEVQDSWFSDYNTYQIRWLNTDEIVPLFVAQDAQIGEYDGDLGFITDDEEEDQPQLYEMDQEWTPFGDNERLITVNVSPVGEDEEDSILETEDWWQQEDLEEPTNGGNVTDTGNATNSS